MPTHLHDLLSRPMAPVVVVAAALLFLWIAWKVFKTTVKLLVVLAVVAAIVVGVLWLRTT